jgi:hypothetical protein
MSTFLMALWLSFAALMIIKAALSSFISRGLLNEMVAILSTLL